MYPQCPLPRHITALYLVAVASCVALFGHSVGVGANVIVYSVSYNREEVDFRDMPAHFGGLLPDEGLKGMVVYAEPANACAPIQPPPNYTGNYLGKWVVLIRRYDCSFEEKVRNAQKANYSAAIVHNVNSSDLEPMSANHPEGIHIPSVFINENAGHVIRDSYQYDEGYYVLINDDLPFNFNANLLLPFAIVVGVCFMILVIFMIVKCIKERRRQRRHRLPSSSLRKIPTAKFAKGDPYETCAICLEDYQEGEKLRILPCSHAYHTKCIDPWLTRNRRVCPVCKRKVFAHDEHVSDTESDTDETDDTTPLVRPGSYGTQGGTFVPQRENPLQRAARLNPSGSLSSMSSFGSHHGQPAVETGTAAIPPKQTPGPSDGDSLSGTPPSTSRIQRTSTPIAHGDEEEALSFNFNSSGEHSINRRSASQSALLGSHSEEAEAGLEPLPVASAVGRNGERREHEMDVVV